jgi:hypothetical protein
MPTITLPNTPTDPSVSVVVLDVGGDPKLSAQAGRFVAGP